MRYITSIFSTGIDMSILPYEQNHELKEGWLKSIEAIEKRCIRPFPPHIKRHKIYQKGSVSTEEVTKLVRMVRDHHDKYRIRWYHKLFIASNLLLSVLVEGAFYVAQGVFYIVLVLLLYVVGFVAAMHLFFTLPLWLGTYFKSPIPFCTSMITLGGIMLYSFDQDK